MLLSFITCFLLLSHTPQLSPGTSKYISVVQCSAVIFSAKTKQNKTKHPTPQISPITDPNLALNSSTALTKGYQCHKVGNSVFTSHFCESSLLLPCLLQIKGEKQLACTYTLFCNTLSQQAENKKEVVELKPGVVFKREKQQFNVKVSSGSYLMVFNYVRWLQS